MARCGPRTTTSRQSAEGAHGYVARAFGNRLAEVRAAMEALAAPCHPRDWTASGFGSMSGSDRKFRRVLKGGAKGELRIERIVQAGELSTKRKSSLS